MKAITLRKSQAKRRFTGILRKLESNQLNRVTIIDAHDHHVGVILNRQAQMNPLEQSMESLRQSITERSDLPPYITPVSSEFVDRMQKLTKGVEIDLDSPLNGDE